MSLIRFKKLFRFDKSSGSEKLCFNNKINYVVFFYFVLVVYSVSFCVVDAYHPQKQGVPSWNGYQYNHPHPPNTLKKFSDPKFVMVDVVNNLGLKLLAIHNENNENNIALSPYGALSVLIALGEGLQGDAVREIQQTANIPNDISVIRVGLRDIHRHLKSYFIPKEGFLAGLTLNHDNVTLKTEYEDILRYYGYDIMAFNNALFPEPDTTVKPITTNLPVEQPFTTTIITQTPTTSVPQVPTIISLGTTTPLEVSTTVSDGTTTTIVPEVSTDISVSTTEIPQVPSIISVSISSAQSEATVTTENMAKEIPNQTSVLPSQFTEGFLDKTSDMTTENIHESEPGSGNDFPKVPGDVSTTVQPVITSTPTSQTTPSSTTQKLTTTSMIMTTTPLIMTTTPSSTSTTPLAVTTTLEAVATTLGAVATTTVEMITSPEVVTTTPLTMTTTPLATTSTQIPTTITSLGTTTNPEVVTTSDVLTTASPDTTVAPITTTTVNSLTTTTLVPITTNHNIDTTEPIVTTVTVTSTSLSTMDTTQTLVTEPAPITTTILGVTETQTVITNVPEVTTHQEAVTVPVVISPISDANATSMNPQDVTTYTMAPKETPSTEITPSETQTTTILTTPTTETIVTTQQTSEGSTTVLLSTTLPSTTEIETVTESKDEQTDSDNEVMSTNDNDGFAGIPINSKLRRSPGNLVELNIIHKKSSTRKSRSVVDYVIARYYDQSFVSRPNHQRPYVPVERPTFLVYGKYREYNIDFMRYDTVLPFYYIPHLDTLALRFPLDNANYYLLLLLPVDEYGIDQLICNLRFNGSLRYIIGNLRYHHVIATIPSFLLKGYVTLTPTFQKLGVRKVFEPRQADFTPMTTEKGIYVTNIEQAITVNIRNYVDPDSPELRRDLRQYTPVEFKADHPFLYFVMDAELQVTLMAGKVVNPLNSRIR